MFEAVILICAAAGAPCEEALVPGFSAPTLSGCEAALTAGVDLPAWPGARVAGEPACREAGQMLEFREVSPGLFVHRGQIAEWNRENRGDMSNIAFVVGDSAVAVIDSGSARWMGEAVLRSIRAVTDLPVTHAIVTHMHPDHALGARVLAAAGAKVVGHAALDRALADRAATYLERLSIQAGADVALGTGVAPVDMAVEDVLRIDLGNRELEIRAWPLSHTGTDVTVLDRQSGALIAVDLVFDTHAPSLDGSLVGWQAVTADLVATDLTAVVPGHGTGWLDWPDGATAQARYLDILARDTRRAIRDGLPLSAAVDTIAGSEADAWALFDVFNPRNATVAFTELEWE